MKINKEEVLKLEKELDCPIVEMFDDGNKWYVCFEQYFVIEGENQKVSIDDLAEEVQKYDNVENFMNEFYIDETKNDSWFKQVTFEWEEKNECSAT